MNRSINIAAKKLGAKTSPYYFYKRNTLHSKIRSLIHALRPMQTEHPLIRIGQGADGGYLVPDDLKGIEYCFSPGVSNLVLFEKHILKTYGIKSFLCDYSVDRPKADFDFKFDKKFVGAYNDDIFMTMDAWYEKYLGGTDTGDMLLQMDIEGGEYPALLNMSEQLLARFRIIVIEMHHLFKMLDYVTFPLIEATFIRLLNSHLVVHIHPNNNQGSIKCGDLEIPDVIEIAFLRKDRAKHVLPATTFPHPLDQDVDDERKPLVLPKCWYEWPGEQLAGTDSKRAK
jgi:hypothetical protein